MKDDLEFFDLDFENEIVSDTVQAIKEEETLEYAQKIEEQYYAGDDSKDEECYLEDGEDDEYYIEDDNNGEFCVVGENDEYYAEDENVEYYVDENGQYYAVDENGEYYAVDENGDYYAVEEDVEYYEDNEGEEYYADDEDSECYVDEEDSEYYANEEDNDDEYYINEDENKQGFSLPVLIQNIKSFFEEGKGMDLVLALTGVVVLVLAIVTIYAWKGSKETGKQVAQMVGIGEELDSVGNIGEVGLTSLENVYAASKQETEEETQIEESKATVDIKVNFTSVEKDLKIKFVNSNTNSLITGTKFEVELTDAKKKVTTLLDDDQDGIIHQTKLSPGTYQVLCKSVGEYKFPTSTTSVKVKEKIDYQKIDIADEVKKESEINASVEDTAKNDVVEESKLADTVEWVESTKTPVAGGETYEEVDKSKITDPSTVARRFGAFHKMSAYCTVSAPGSVMAGETFTATLGGTDSLDSGCVITWNVSGGTIVSGQDTNSIQVTAGASGSVSITANVTGKKTTTNPDDPTNSTVEDVKESPSTTVSIKEAEVAKVNSVSISKMPAASVEQGKTTTVSAIVDATGSISTDINWSCSSGASISPTTTASGAEATITIDANTTDNITITAVAVGDTSKTATATITVTKKPVAAYVKSVTAENVSLLPGETTKMKATVLVEGSIDSGVTWSSSEEDKKYVQLSSDGTIKALEAGIGKVINVKATSVSNDKDGNKVVGTAQVTIRKPVVELALNPKELSILQGEAGTITAKVTGLSNTSVVFRSADEKVAKVSDAGVVTGNAVGTTTITVTAADGVTSATCKVVVNKNIKADKVTKLKDNQGNQLYIKENGKYREAVYADYYTAQNFYSKKAAAYKYTGWQTIDEKTYYFTKNGDKVTGDQVIQGVKYHFDNNGILSMGNGTLGIDVSKWNGNINWQAVKNSGVSYVIIRCGYRGSSSGVLVEDPKFKANIQGATAAGLKVGVYFFSQAINEVEAIEEASMTLNLIKNYNVSYPVFLDVEGSGGRGDRIDSATRTKVINAYCQTIKNSGYTAGVYANKTWLESKMNASALSGYRIWLAQYAAKPTYKGRYDMWQYTSRGTIGGISGHVDLNTSFM